MNEEPATEIVVRKLYNRKKIITITLIFLSFVLVCGIIFSFFYSKSQRPTFPKEVKSQITGFQPYYIQGKEQLPAGFKTDKNTVRYEVGTLLFTLTSPDGKSVTISQQPVPKEFSAEGGNFVGKESIDTKNGKATISYVQGRTSAFMITNDRKTMIILNSNQSLETDTIRSILSNLTSV